MTSKISQTHLERTACVYLRQSTIAQVRDNPESTARQYALADRARILGWPTNQVRVLDADLGKSGKIAEGRDDFHHLCAAVGLGEVGAVFALEASRLSRSQADWHRLLDLCAWTHTLLIDHDGIYDPNEFNDRVLLGFKGTFSHTELHAMRMRLHGARRAKARRGEFRFRPPTGYVHDEGGALVLDPDEGVVAAIRQVFALFRSLGSGYAVARYFAAKGWSFPRRRWMGGSVLGPAQQ
jgi:DNA invertase Pin-like site-specific DNA recombinase